MKTIILTIAFFIACLSLEAQINVKQKAKDKSIQRADQKVDNGIDKTLDKFENGVKSIFKKKNKKKEGEEEIQESSENSDSNYVGNNNSQNSDKNQAIDNKNKSDKDEEKIKNQTSSLASYSKYDFVAGEKVIFFDDFSQDNVGDFPALWNTNGSAEVVTTNQYPGHWMKFSTYASIWTDQLLKLPENYTIEFDIIPIKGTEGSMAGYNFRMIQTINAKAFDAGAVPGKAGFAFSCAYYGAPSYRSYTNDDNAIDLNGRNDDELNKQIENQKYHISIWVQKSRIRFYLNQNKLFDLPKALQGVNMDRIRFEEGAALVSNVRVAIGTPDMRNKLLTEGKLVTRGILFDSGSDKIKPESYGTLKEIASILKESNVKVKIVGHTDSDGDDKMNLDLSQRRGLAVKNTLIKDFGISASSLESDGKGESEPVDNNNSIEGKANNRRVEFIKM
jgi:outer membrane protein OmpA-like peptidoglycan-associated protein